MLVAMLDLLRKPEFRPGPGHVGVIPC
jgi:hypothetical protein